MRTLILIKNRENNNRGKRRIFRNREFERKEEKITVKDRIAEAAGKIAETKIKKAQEKYGQKEDENFFEVMDEILKLAEKAAEEAKAILDGKEIKKSKEETIEDLKKLTERLESIEYLKEKAEAGQSLTEVMLKFTRNQNVPNIRKYQKFILKSLDDIKYSREKIKQLLEKKEDKDYYRMVAGHHAAEIARLAEHIKLANDLIFKAME